MHRLIDVYYASLNVLLLFLRYFQMLFSLKICLFCLLFVQEISFTSVQVDSPRFLVVNGRKLGASKEVQPILSTRAVSDWLWWDCIFGLCCLLLLIQGWGRKGSNIFPFHLRFRFVVFISLISAVLWESLDDSKLFSCHSCSCLPCM